VRRKLTHCDESVRRLEKESVKNKPSHNKRDTYAWLVRKVVCLLQRSQYVSGLDGRE
jgi:hypothetical protein